MILVFYVTCVFPSPCHAHSHLCAPISLRHLPHCWSTEHAVPHGFLSVLLQTLWGFCCKVSFFFCLIKFNLIFEGSESSLPSWVQFLHQLSDIISHLLLLFKLYEVLLPYFLLWDSLLAQTSKCSIVNNIKVYTFANQSILCIFYIYLTQHFNSLIFLKIILVQNNEYLKKLYFKLKKTWRAQWSALNKPFKSLREGVCQIIGRSFVHVTQLQLLSEALPQQRGDPPA